MVTLEKVEKLCERANITYDEAKALLEETNADILEAIIKLEKDGRIMAPSGGGYYNSMHENQNSESNCNEKQAKEKFNKEEGSSFSELMGKLFRWCGKVINRGNRNTFDVIKNGENIMSIPVTVMALLLIFMFWFIVPLIIVGLFFKYRYLFSGPDLGKEDINKAMDTFADAAENLKKEVNESKGEDNNGKNFDNRG